MKNDGTVASEYNQRKPEEHTLCQIAHQWNPNPISRIPAKDQQIEKKSTLFQARNPGDDKQTLQRTPGSLSQPWVSGRQ